jgi:hypothetical protein
MDRPSRGGNSEYDLWRVDQEGFNGVTKISFSATILVLQVLGAGVVVLRSLVEKSSKK